MGLYTCLIDGPTEYALSILTERELLEALAEAWKFAKQRPRSSAIGEEEWDESTWAHWYYVAGLDSDAAAEAAREERERRSRAHWYDKIRRYDVRAWHTTWGTTAHEERVRQITEAWAEVGEEPPGGALWSAEELNAARSC